MKKIIYDKIMSGIQSSDIGSLADNTLIKQNDDNYISLQDFYDGLKRNAQFVKTIQMNGQTSEAEALNLNQQVSNLGENVKILFVL